MRCSAAFGQHALAQQLRRAVRVGAAEPPNAEEDLQRKCAICLRLDSKRKFAPFFQPTACILRRAQPKYGSQPAVCAELFSHEHAGTPEQGSRTLGTAAVKSAVEQPKRPDQNARETAPTANPTPNNTDSNFRQHRLGLTVVEPRLLQTPGPHLRARDTEPLPKKDCSAACPVPKRATAGLARAPCVEVSDQTQQVL